MGNRDDVRDLGLAIDQLCELTGLSRRELSRRTGIDRHSLTDYVKGRVRPTPQTMDRIAAVFNVPPAFIERIKPLNRAARLAYEQAIQHGKFADLPAGDETAGLKEKIGSAALDAMAPFLQQFASLDRDPTPRAEDRLWAEALWARMEQIPAEERSRDQSLIVDVLLGDERTWALAERICLASEASAANRADEALRLAQLAVRIAEAVSGADWRLYLLGWVKPYLANALRVGGDLAASSGTLAHADELWQQGAAGASYVPLDTLRRLELKATLLRYYGRFEEASSVIAEALTGARTEHARGRLLIMEANILTLAGQYEAAIEVLAAAKPLIHRQREPRLTCVLHFNWTVNCLHLDRYSDAELLLPLVEALIDPANELDGIRLRWLQGRAWAGLGRREEAVAALAGVRGYFHAEAIAYDYAVVSVELGTLLLEEGRAREVRELAEEMMWIFESQGIHEEALKALALFCHAAKAEQAQLDWTRRLVKYLYRAQSDPGLKFDR